MAGYLTLSNFTIEDAQPTRVYFDSSNALVGTSATTNGFTISGKTITGCTIINGATTGHYFTVSSAFNFWDNTQIRYEGNNQLPWVTGNTASDLTDGANTLNDFSLEEVTNNIAEPASTGEVIYVDVAATGANDGTSEADAYTNPVTAMLNAGASATIYIKAGLYNFTVGQHGTIYNSGTATNPVKIIGYKTTPGDITTPYYTIDPTLPAPTLDPTEMPVFDLQQSNTYGLLFFGISYCIIKNLQFTEGTAGIALRNGCSNIVVDNCVVLDMYRDNTFEGTGFQFDGDFTHPTYEPSYVRYTNSVVSNAGSTNFQIRGSYNLIKNCVSYCDKDNSGDQSLFGTDYHFHINGDFNTCINSESYTITNDVNNSAHIFSSRGPSDGTTQFKTTTSYNLWKNLYSKNHGSRAIEIRNPETNYNVYKDIEIEGFGIGSNDGGVISIRSGASYNLVERVYSHNTNKAIEFYNNLEGGTDPLDFHADGNLIRNCVFDTMTNAMLIRNVSAVNVTLENNKVYNCTFVNAVNMQRGYNDSFTMTGNELRNNIFKDIPSENYDPLDAPLLADMWATIDTNNFFGSATPASATNTITGDPGFNNETDDTGFVPSNTSFEVASTLVDEDYDIEERSATTAIGFKKI